MRGTEPDVFRRAGKGEGGLRTSYATRIAYLLRYAGFLAAMLSVLLPRHGFAESDLQARSEAQRAAGGSSSPEWSALVNRSPYPFKPLAPAERSIVDGTYTKVDPKNEPPVACRRCPDYAPEGGLWKLQLDKGVFRIFHAPSRWKSIGSFKMEGDRLSLFNDPVCHETVGLYTWTFKDNQLFLEEMADDCAIRLRATNLTKQPWLSCRPPSAEAAVSGHWLEPSGCQ
jgi:hypothetical protein